MARGEVCGDWVEWVIRVDRRMGKDLEACFGALRCWVYELIASIDGTVV